MDESILIIVIGCIIVLQIVVFVRNLVRIFSYKQSIGNVDNYKIKHSIVPEEFIDELSVRDILLDNIPKSLQSVPEELENKQQRSKSEDDG